MAATTPQNRDRKPRFLPDRVKRRFRRICPIISMLANSYVGVCRGLLFVCSAHSGSEASRQRRREARTTGRFYGCNVSDRNNIYQECGPPTLRRETHASFDRMNDKPQNQMNNKPQNMKKLLLLMAGCAALFSSCLKGYEGTSAPSTLPYYSLYINTMNQSVFSLDPFDVAFRLNTLIVEGNGDYEAAPSGSQGHAVRSGNDPQRQRDGRPLYPSVQRAGPSHEKRLYAYGRPDNQNERIRYADRTGGPAGTSSSPAKRNTE